MGQAIRLKGAGGDEIGAYHAKVPDARRGGLVVVQEIFGITDHIRELCEDFAADGYETIAPAFFDRLEQGFEAGYDEAGFDKGRRYSAQTPWDQVAGDLQASIDMLKPPVFVAGYCWGGAAAWLAACRCAGLSAASCFYGRRITELVEETPTVPAILHFGKHDASIPLESVRAIADRHPEVPIYLYEAGHGFVSDRRPDDDADSARLARLRTLQLFANNGGGRSAP